jgi:aryl-alcohol dehydrogenase-like predicted oxidoreductase
LVTAFDDATSQGKAREIGASNYTADRLEALLDTAGRLGARPVTVFQPQYNLVMRHEYEGALQDLCVARGIAVLPFYGLASGFLSGKYRKADDFAGHARAHALNQAAAHGGWDVLTVMDDIVRDTGATHAQIALAWLNAQPGIAAPLASATSLEQLAQLVAAVSLTLEPAQIAALDAAAA